MAEKLERKFELDAPIEMVWPFLTDPYEVASCLPGAAITGKIDERAYNGTIAVQVGLVRAEYQGKAAFERVDPMKREAVVTGVGQEVKGRGSAEVRLVGRLRAVRADKTEVTVNSEVQITGVIAQLSRGMIDSAADQMLRQFTDQLKAKLDLARAKYAQVVKAHAESFAKIYGQKLAEVQTLAGIKVHADGSNNASSPGDVMRYLEAIRRVAGEMIYNSARIILKNAAQKEKVPLTEL